VHLEQRKVAEHQAQQAVRFLDQLPQDGCGAGTVRALIVAVLEHADRSVDVAQDVLHRDQARAGQRGILGTGGQGVIGWGQSAIVPLPARRWATQVA
jgi:hypothetical protein